MANVRDSDTSLWLHNKLGISNDSWTSGSICSQLNAEVLKNIKDCFPDLQTQVKLKLLLSFFHIPRRNVEEWRNELEEIIEVAAVDSDLWVAMLAEVLKTFPATGTLNTEIAEFDETRPIFSDMIGELRRELAKHSDLNLLPLECLYLNKNALVSVVGQQPNPVKHFTLKRKPKSVALRSELLAKAAEIQANQKKAQAPTVPVRSRGMPRKMTDTTPLKGLPTRWAARTGSRVLAPISRPPPRSGIKLLDINEQPATHAQIKKRRKLEIEEGAKKQPPAAPPSPPPDYAKGLNYQMPKADDQTSSETLTSANNMETTVQSETEVNNSTPPEPPTSEPNTILLQQPAAKPIVIGQQPKLLISQAGGKSVLLSTQNLLNSSAVTILQGGGKTVVLQNIKPLTPAGHTTARVVQQIAQPIMQMPGTVQSTQLPVGGVHSAPPAPTAPPVQPSVPAAPTAPVNVQSLPHSDRDQQEDQQIQIQQPAPPQQTLVQRRGLSLTREQMLEAQDMFRNANRVTRPEKALILGFMAGSRDNPCPNLGNIVTIKLSENYENVIQSDDTFVTMVAEMHFQMNYNNGQWTRLKKYRPLDGAVPQKILPGSSIIAPNNQSIVTLTNQNGS
ncbi:Negative elongation factor A [Papilio machaon]|uniref:Negative elongation factor A n=1 Tax=Papilio machaon TaxID=76193 RepID=A0A0N0PE60_PAPMA|nr:negative elongation factor A [Papilio machaon]KPJ19142.1 Negative elongation factor A [Papilio machaon]